MTVAERSRRRVKAKGLRDAAPNSATFTVQTTPVRDRASSVTATGRCLRQAGAASRAVPGLCTPPWLTA